MIYCSKCGKENLDSNEFCEYCGTPLKNIPPQTTNVNPQGTSTLSKQVNSTPTIVTVLLLIFMFPIGVIVMWIWPKWKKWVKILITLLALISVLLIFLGAALLDYRDAHLGGYPAGLLELESMTEKRNRDTTRISDLEVLESAIKIALTGGEIVLISTSSCTTCTSNKGTSAVDGKSGWVKFDIPAGKKGLARYLPSLPIDPSNTGEYVYYFESNPGGYEINAVLEDNTKMTSDRGTDSYFYEVGNDLNIR